MSDLKDALERAKEYRQKKVEAVKSQSTEETESRLEQAAGQIQEWRDVVSQRIEEAMRAGEFDNLRNKGKPIKIERNPFVPADMEMANHLLENNDLPPAWITDRMQILSAIEKFRSKLRTTPKLDGVPHKRQVDAWREEVRTLNKRIEIVNLAQPIASLEIYKLVLDDELAKVQSPIS